MFNQDPIENFFGQIRQHGAQNKKPTTAASKEYFKFAGQQCGAKYCKRHYCEGSLLFDSLVNIQAPMNSVPLNLSSPKVWDLPARPNDFDFQKPLANSDSEFINHIFEEKMLNASYTI